MNDNDRIELDRSKAHLAMIAIWGREKGKWHRRFYAPLMKEGAVEKGIKIRLSRLEGLCLTAERVVELLVGVCM